MNNVIPLPKRCAYLGCQKAIRTDRGQISVKRGDKYFHSGCLPKHLGDDTPPSGGGVALQILRNEKAFRKRMKERRTA